jgi:hypothetical protein
MKSTIRQPAYTTIKVTAADIASGKRNNPRSCPISLALSRTLGMSYANAGGHAWPTNGSRISKLLPKEAREFVINFDSRLPVAAFSFKFEGKSSS